MLRLSRTEAKKFLGSNRVVVIESRRLARAPARGRAGFGLDRGLRPVVDTIDLVLPAAPSTNALFHNREDGGRGKTKAYDDWLKEAGHRLNCQRPGRIVGPYEIEIQISRSRKDLDNHLKPVLDLLVKHRVVDDDKHVQRIILSWQDSDIGVLVIARVWRGE